MDTATSPVAAEPRKSSLGITSLMFAALTVFSPIVIGLLTGRAVANDVEAHRDSGLGVVAMIAAGVLGAAVVAGISGLIGTLAGIAALVRKEQSVWRPVAGLLINGPVTAFVLYLVVMFWSNNAG